MEMGKHIMQPVVVFFPTCPFKLGSSHKFFFVNLQFSVWLSVCLLIVYLVYWAWNVLRCSCRSSVGIVCCCMLLLQEWNGTWWPSLTGPHGTTCVCWPAASLGFVVVVLTAGDAEQQGCSCTACAVIQCKLSCLTIVKESYESFLFKCYTTELIKEVHVCV